jgi:hypothetical protein
MRDSAREDELRKFFGMVKKAFEAAKPSLHGALLHAQQAMDRMKEALASFGDELESSLNSWAEEEDGEPATAPTSECDRADCEGRGHMHKDGTGKWWWCPPVKFCQGCGSPVDEGAHGYGVCV